MLPESDSKDIASQENDTSSTENANQERTKSEGIDIKPEIIPQEEDQREDTSPKNVPQEENTQKEDKQKEETLTENVKQEIDHKPKEEIIFKEANVEVESENNFNGNIQTDNEQIASTTPSKELENKNEIFFDTIGTNSTQIEVTVQQENFGDSNLEISQAEQNKESVSEQQVAVPTTLAKQLIVNALENQTPLSNPASQIEINPTETQIKESNEDKSKESEDSNSISDIIINYRERTLSTASLSVILEPKTIPEHKFILVEDSDSESDTRSSEYEFYKLKSSSNSIPSTFSVRVTTEEKDSTSSGGKGQNLKLSALNIPVLKINAVNSSDSNVESVTRS